MAENGITGKVIGVAFDGTGFGTDGKIWGGEFLIADFAGFERRAHFRYIPLAGGDTAVREPWRLAPELFARYLRRARSIHSICRSCSAVPPKKLATVRSMIERRINTVETSACGRLFDAVASIAGVRRRGQLRSAGRHRAGSSALAGSRRRAIRSKSRRRRPGKSTCGRPSKASCATSSRAGRQAGSPPRSTTLSRPSSWRCAGRLRAAEGIHRVCLSGGTFQNVYLLERAVAGLRSDGFEVFLHSKVPPNDGGISLGQAVIANHVLASR